MFDHALVCNESSLATYFVVVGYSKVPPSPRGTRCEYVSVEQGVEACRTGLRANPHLLGDVRNLMLEHGLWSDVAYMPSVDAAIRCLTRALREEPRIRVVREVPRTQGTSLRAQKLVIEEMEHPSPDPSWIEVKVETSDGKVLPNIACTFESMDGALQQASTNEAGLARCDGILAGRCRVTVGASAGGVR